MSAYYTGTTDVYYAVMNGEDKTGTKPTYGTPKVLGKSIEITCAATYKEGSLYASNSRVKGVKFIDKYDVTLNLDQIADDVRKEILGRDEDANGVQSIGNNTDAPYVAIGFGLTMDDGTKELWWMYKGRFAELEVSGTTETDAIEFKTPTISASFDRRICDNKVAVVVNSANTKAATIAPNWFNAVYESPASA